MQRQRPWMGLWIVGLVLTTVTAISTAGAAGASGAPSHRPRIVGGGADAIPGSYIVVFTPAVDVEAATRRLAGRYRLEVRHVYTAALHGFAAAMTPAQAHLLAAQDDVAYVQQNHLAHIHGVQPNPPSWGLDRVDQRLLPLDSTYTYSTTASNVHAYIVDTGIRRTHVDFGGRAITGIDEITPGGPADDCNGHGTHVAGTVGGASYGVAKGVTLVAVRVLNCNGVGTTADVAAGVDWITSHAVKPAVANMSLGSVGDTALDTAVATSIASGVVYAVSAGNSNASACGFSPARVPTALTAEASDTNDNRASFSNYGPCVDVVAPGVAIPSDWFSSDTATQILSGTSMASPHVAGTAALLLAFNPTWTAAQVAASLISRATPGVVVNRISGPNLMLYTGTTPPPPPPANNFDLSATPNPMVLTPGQSATTTVQTTHAPGDAAQTATLSTAGLPPGVTATFNPPSVQTGVTPSVVTFTASAGTPTGRFIAALIATGSTVTHRLTFTLLVGTNQGTFYPLTPQRILDTRTGNGAPVGPVGPATTLRLQVDGRGGVPPSGVSAVVLNVTSTGATAPSFVTVYPTGVPRPNASVLNLVPGWTGANSVTVAVGNAGRVDLFNNNGYTQLIADVVGFYAADASVVAQFGVGGEYQPVVPERVFDSRDPAFGHRVPGGSSVQVPVDYGADTNPHIRALVVNVTAVNSSADGYLTTWNGSGPPPSASTLNYTADGSAVPNMAIAPVAPCCGGFPAIGVFTSVTSDIIVDIMGFVDDRSLGDGLRFTPRTPVRVADTRIGLGASRLGQGVTAAITVPATVAPAGTVALALNVTAVAPTAWTYLSVWPAAIPGLTQPPVSTLNPRPGQTEPNSVYPLIGSTSAFNVYNNAGSTDVLADVAGTFWDPAAPPAASTERPRLGGHAGSARPAPLAGSGRNLRRLASRPPTTVGKRPAAVNRVRR